MSNYPESKRSQPSGGSRPEEHSLTREDHPGKKHQSVRAYWERQIPHNRPTSRPRIPDDSDRSSKQQRGYEDDNGDRFNPTPPRYAEEEDDYDMEDRTNEQQRGYEDEDMEDRANFPSYTNPEYNQQEIDRSKRIQTIGRDRVYDPDGDPISKRTFVGMDPQGSDEEDWSKEKATREYKNAIGTNTLGDFLEKVVKVQIKRLNDADDVKNHDFWLDVRDGAIIRARRSDLISYADLEDYYAPKLAGETYKLKKQQGYDRDDDDLDPSPFQIKQYVFRKEFERPNSIIPNVDLLRKVEAYATENGTMKGMKLLIQVEDNRQAMTVLLPYLLEAFAVTVIADNKDTIEGPKNGPSMWDWFASHVNGVGMFKTYIMPDKEVDSSRWSMDIVPRITRYSPEMKKTDQNVTLATNVIMIAEKQLIKSNTVLTSVDTANGSEEVQVPIFEALTKRENHLVIVHDAHKVSSTMQKKIFESFDTVIFVGKVHDERGVFHMELK